jgi:DoxX-like family
MQTANVSKGQLWTGRILSGLVSLLFLSSILMYFFGRKMVDEGMNKYGYSHTAGTAILFTEFLIGVLMAIPRTSVFGVMMLTAYLGGAVSTHVRAGEPFIIPIVVAIIAWAGIMLREPKLRELLPIRK